MRPRRWLTLAAASLMATVVLPTGVALADRHGISWVDQDESTIDVGAAGGWSTNGDEPVKASSVPVCEWEPVPEDSLLAKRWASENAFVLYYKICPGEPRDVVEIPLDDSGGGTPPQTAWEQALKRLVLPEPRIELNPSEPVVHMETWLWVEGATWRVRSAAASAAGVTATVTATPRRVTWDMGNGDVVVCDGPGTRYDPSKAESQQSTDCSYVYRHTSADQPDGAYRVTATVEWELTWDVAGAAGGGALPPGFTSFSLLVPVSEMQALNQ